MKFYRENKINPFASCLPLLAQLPVFLALFYMLQNDLRLRHLPGDQPAGHGDPQPCGDGGDAQFLFIPDLTDKATGGVLVVLIVLYVGSQLLSTLLMSTTTDRTQRMIFLALPFFFVLFVINFPAGLLVYWITTNLWTIVQQAIVRKALGPMRPPGRRGHGACCKRAAAAPPTTRRAKKARRAAEGRGRRAPATSPRAGRAARRPAAAQEEARREATMSDQRPSRRVAELLEAWRGARPRRRTRRGGRRGRSGDRARGRGPRAVHRPPRADDRRRPAPGLQGRQPRRGGRGGRAWSSTPPATASAASRRCTARPTGGARRGPRSGRPVALDAMSATERKVVHEYLKDRDDVETYSRAPSPTATSVVAARCVSRRVSRETSPAPRGTVST